MELVRKLLQAVEAEESAYGLKAVELGGESEDRVKYQLRLLVDAGLVREPEYSEWPKGEGRHRSPLRIYTQGYVLTWQGHEFLDLAMSESVWKKAIGKCASVAGRFSFELLLATLKSVAAQQMGLS
jgi:hypothetical protein